MRDLIRRSVVWSSTPVGLAVLFATGLLIRLVLAGGGGFPFDMSSFAGWANRLAERGPWNFYPGPGEKFFVDYPPGYLYVLWGLGRLTRALGGGTPSVFWLKLPPIFADLGMAWLAGLLATRLAPASLTRRLDLRGPAAAAVLLNPAVFFISAVWGQADVFLALPVLGALILLGTGEPTFRREVGGIALLAVAIGTKPQAAFALPMVALFLLWRHLRNRLAGAETGSGLGRAIAGGLGRLAALAVVGALAGFALLLPFRLGPVDAFDFYSQAAGTYPVTSVFAFNGWGVFGFWRPDSGADAFRIFGVPAFVWGLALFSLGGALVCARAWQSLRSGEDEGRVLVFGSVAITLVGFVVLTRVHERYLFLPIALLAAFIGIRWMLRVFAGLSVIYLVNVFFPYVYYLKYVGRPAPTLGGAFDAFYGDVGGIQMRILSALTAGACLYVAARGWRALEAIVTDEEGAEERPVPVPVERPARWSLQLHDVGRQGAVLAAVAFAIALLTRLPGLGHPPGMYFDEVYHARTGAEYLAGKEVFEWTHPPLAKELIAYSIDALSGFGALNGGDLPRGTRPRGITSGPSGVRWIQGAGARSIVQAGRLDASCGLDRTRTVATVGFRAHAIATDDGSIFVAGVDGDQQVVARLDGRRQRWRANLPGEAEQLVALGDRVFVLTSDGAVVFVSAEGVPRTLAVDAAALASEPDADPNRSKTKDQQDRVAEALPHPGREGVVWGSFPGRGKVIAWNADGGQATEIAVTGRPRSLTAPDDSDRLIVATEDRLTVLDPKKEEIAYNIDGGADLLTNVPETEIAWAATAKTLRAIEPRSGAVIGNVRIARAPVALVPDRSRHRLLAVTDVGMECAFGRPQFAWRLGSVVMGSAMVALVLLIALRLFGNVWLAGLAALFLTVEGLAFTMSRIAIPESYTTAFLLAAWFCALSAMHRWDGGPRRSRVAVFGWLVGTGLFAGAAGASKWVAVYGFAAICLFFVWDGLRRGRSGIWGIAEYPLASLIVFAICLGALPLIVYVATYVPYLGLGHSVGELLRLQGQMFGYHANLDAAHPFSSPWFGWPFGYKAVFLYLAGEGAERSEIWTIPNLVVFWGGLAGVVMCFRRARRARDAALGLVVYAAVMQYIPWAAVGRVIFLYHFMPVVPFLAIGLAWWLIVGLREHRYQRLIVAAVAVGAVAFFILVLPMLEGWRVPVRYLDEVRNALPWVVP